MNEPYLVFKQCLAILPGAQVLAPLYAAVLAEDDWPEAVKLARDALWSRASDARAESDAITSLPSWSKAGLDHRLCALARTCMDVAEVLDVFVGGEEVDPAGFPPDGLLISACGTLLCREMEVVCARRICTAELRPRCVDSELGASPGPTRPEYR